MSNVVLFGPELDREFDLTYALAKKVPSMRNGFTVSTAYGDIWIDGSDACLLAAQVEAILSAQLRALREDF